MKLLIIILVIILIFIVVFKVNNYDMTYVQSNIDNQYYMVRDLEDKQTAADILAKLKKNMFILSNYLYNEIDNEEYKKYSSYIKQLNDRIKNSIIVESSSNSEYTSYSVNKGEQLVFCIRSIKNKDNIHDINLMMYVVLHEMAHVGCPEVGHTILFKKIFAFFVTTAIKLGLYTRIPFETQEREYCGMSITDSII